MNIGELLWGIPETGSLDDSIEALRKDIMESNNYTLNSDIYREFIQRIEHLYGSDSKRNSTSTYIGKCIKAIMDIQDEGLAEVTINTMEPANNEEATEVTTTVVRRRRR